MLAYQQCSYWNGPNHSPQNYFHSFTQACYKKKPNVPKTMYKMSPNECKNMTYISAMRCGNTMKSSHFYSAWSHTTIESFKHGGQMMINHHKRLRRWRWRCLWGGTGVVWWFLMHSSDTTPSDYMIQFFNQKQKFFMTLPEKWQNIVINNVAWSI